VTRPKSPSASQMTPVSGSKASQQWRVAPDLLEEQIDKEELPVESKVQQ